MPTSDPFDTPRQEFIIGMYTALLQLKFKELLECRGVDEGVETWVDKAEGANI